LFPVSSLSSFSRCRCSLIRSLLDQLFSVSDSLLPIRFSRHHACSCQGLIFMPGTRSPACSFWIFLLSAEACRLWCSFPTTSVFFHRRSAFVWRVLCSPAPIFIHTTSLPRFLLGFSVHVLIQHRRSDFLLHSRFSVSGSRLRASVPSCPPQWSALLTVHPRSKRPDFSLPLHEQGFTVYSPGCFIHFIFCPRFGLCCQQQLGKAAFQESFSFTSFGLRLSYY
jgi:hypothetical protein